MSYAIARIGMMDENTSGTDTKFLTRWYKG